MTKNLLLLLTVLALLTIPASADTNTVVYTTFGSGYDFSTPSSPGSWTVGYYYDPANYPGSPPRYWIETMPFTPTSTVNLASVNFAAYLNSPGAPSVDSGVVDVSVLSGSVPDSATVLEDLGTVNVTSTTGAVYTADSALNPVLTAGQTYFVELTSVPNGDAGDVEWIENDQGIETGFRFYDSSNGWGTSNDPTLAAFQVNATPEPGFYGVLALGLSGLLISVRRLRKA
jgi:hypothetical protein